MEKEEIECPSCGKSSQYTRFRLVALISAFLNPRDSHPNQEVLYARICPECGVLFHAKDYDPPKTKR
jgi:ribosomal protein S27AE